MKKTLISSLVALSFVPAIASAQIFSDEVMNSGYTSIGIERVELDEESSLRDGTLGEMNMFSITRGYEINRYFFLEGGVSLPIDNEVTNEFENTFIDGCEFTPGTGCTGGTQESEILTNEIKPSVILDLGFRFELPVHNRLTLFATLGYSYTRMSYSGNYAVDSATGDTYFNLIDVPPAPEMGASASRGCLVDGGAALNEDGVGRIGCDNVYTFNDKYGAKGGTYGVGFSLNFSPDSSFVFEYKKYSHDSGSLEPQAFSASYQWRF